MATIINCTPHAITLVSDHNVAFDPKSRSYKLNEGEEVVIKATIPPSGEVARCSMTEQIVGEVNGTPLVKNTYGQIEGLPEPQPDTFYVVSALVATAAKRPDLLIPSRMVRDNEGKILGCTAFGTV
jgi:hypothetical protein